MSHRVDTKGSATATGYDSEEVSLVHTFGYRKHGKAWAIMGYNRKMQFKVFRIRIRCKDGATPH